MKKLNNLEDLLVHELQDLYSAEKQIIEALPKMAQKASSSKLKQAFNTHLDETKEQLKRLEGIAENYNFKLDGHTCKAMKGIISEGEDLLDKAEDIDPEVLDAALIGAAQRVEHYEIAGYGTARTYAEQLGYEDTMETLQQTLDEEGETNKKLTKMAVEKINFKAVN